MSVTEVEGLVEERAESWCHLSDELHADVSEAVFGHE